jgi:hypothetical protein
MTALDGYDGTAGGPVTNGPPVAFRLTELPIVTSPGNVDNR